MNELRVKYHWDFASAYQKVFLVDVYKKEPNPLNVPISNK